VGKFAFWVFNAILHSVIVYALSYGAFYYDEIASDGVCTRLLSL